MDTDLLTAVAGRELEKFRLARSAGDLEGAWQALERAHIASQPLFFLHCRTHATMFRYAVEQRDWVEARGQLFRFVLVPLGHATGRLPVGNTGRARVSAFKQMSIPPDLAAELGSD